MNLNAQYTSMNNFNKLQPLIDKLKNPLTKTHLSFRNIHSINDDVINVSYYGHEVGGSYISENSVVPKYVDDLEYSTNRKVHFKKRNSAEGGFGSDVYYFDVLISNSLNKNLYVPKGKLLCVRNCYAAFISEFGYDWAFLYLLHTNIVNKNIPFNTNIKIKRNNIYIDDVLIARIVEYEKETSHYFSHGRCGYNRTHFNAVYDLLIPSNQLADLFFKKYMEIVNLYLKKFNSETICVDIKFKSIIHQKETIGVYFNDKNKNFTLGSDWFIASKDYIEKNVHNKTTNQNKKCDCKFPYDSDEYDNAVQWLKQINVYDFISCKNNPWSIIYTANILWEQMLNDEKITEENPKYTSTELI